MANDRYPAGDELDRRRSSNPEHFDRVRLSGTKPRGRGGAGSKTVRPAAVLVRLAERLGKDPEQLASELPADTVRRLRHPLIEESVEDGKREFRHDAGIVSGVNSLIKI